MENILNSSTHTILCDQLPANGETDDEFLYLLIL